MTTKPLKLLLLSLPTVVVAGMILAMGMYLINDTNRASIALKPLDKPLPLIELKPLDANDAIFHTDEIKHNGGLINVFASWCTPCLAEHPYLMSLSKHYNIPIYGINWKDETKNAQAMLSRNGNPYKMVGQDPEGQSALKLGITGVPETFIVNKNGMITHKIIGPITQELLEIELKPLLLP